MEDVPLFLLVCSFLLPHLSSVAAVPSNVWGRTSQWTEPAKDREEVGAEATESDQKLSFILATRACGGLLNLR